MCTILLKRSRCKLPGQALSELEKKLKKRWESPSKADHFLRSIEIAPMDDSQSTPGLRGIISAKLEFNYPVTVLVGPNGAGKSTFLNLAALSTNGDGTAREGAGPYRFPDFFYSVRTEPQPTNFQITWLFRNHDVEKSTNMRRTSTRKWMDYDRRYKTGVLHIGLNRIASYSESSSHKRAFNSANSPSSESHARWVYSSMTKIFGKEYTESVDLKMGKFSIPHLSLGSSESYSGFNMGTGESAVLFILAQIASMPRGSLILIEEIELAVHPSAQKTMAKVLLERSFDQNLQVVCTSHSRWFIDALPREARILIQRSPDGSHICLPNVTTRMAEGVLSQEIVEELVVICEDDVAKEIISLLVPVNVRSRMRIIAAGAKTELVSALYYLKIANPKLPILIVWDSDVDDKTIRAAYEKVSDKKALAEFRGIGWSRLGDARVMGADFKPNVDNAPEKEISRTLRNDVLALKSLAEFFGADPEAVREWLHQAVITSSDHHAFFYEFSKLISLPTEQVLLVLCRQYASVLVRDDLIPNPVVQMITKLLDGEKLKFEIPCEGKEPNAGNVSNHGDLISV